MFFGLTNSPATFQTMMNIFWDQITEGVVCMYLDDILIYTKPKCWRNTVGSPISSWSASASTSSTSSWRSVAGVVEWPEPQNKKEVQAFLGFANFYWRFIQDFWHHACLLFDLMGKDVMWSWGPPEQMAFDTLKHAVTSGPVLLFLDNNSPFCVEANSSNFATGAVLSQQSPEDGKWHSVAFYSKNLNAVEWNYEIHNKGMLAIIWSFKEWWHFLEGAWHKFKV
ncbi:hypothetical protein E4T56_gene11389 [Termitomyces sp. T112]|nr:hypothetical protein E4T56_gene11389 [Termitomyces sp. T112]